MRRRSCVIKNRDKKKGNTVIREGERKKKKKEKKRNRTKHQIRTLTMRGSTSERRDRPRPVGYQYHIITMGQAIRTKRRRKWRSDVLIQEKARHSKSQSSTGGTIPPLPTGPDHHQQCPPEGFRNRTPPDQIKQFVSPTISTEASPPPPTSPTSPAPRF